jgi:class 3 adenylate cyclase/predicted ATPase
VDHLSELLNTVVTHLPRYLVEDILQRLTPGEPSGRFIDGTLLFADISGFTAMSERLSHIGREGAEEITLVVNRYFSMMLSILREYHGQLIKFGGDALLGLFLSADGSAGSTTATRAVQAAQRMQAAMAAFAQTETSQGVFPLRMKVGVHKGHFFAAQLGSPEGMEYALFGADVNATAAAESSAVAGQVLVDRDTLQAISVPCSTISTDQQYVLVEHIEPALTLPPPLPPLIPGLQEPSLENLHLAVGLLDALVPYLPAGLLARLASDPGAASLQGEHRLVAVLFANVEGLGETADHLGPGCEAEVVTILNQYFVAMEEAIHRFGGVINKIDLYDHGDKLLAFFGAPFAHEDDAERAVRAALAMQAALEEVNARNQLPVRLTQRIGISFGYVFAGYVGTGWRHEYTVMGDEVNLAARLMSVAPLNGPTTSQRCIIVSSDIRRKVQALFDLDPQGDVQLKGKSKPIPIFSVVGPRAMPEPLRGLKGMRSPLVGRDREWKQLHGALAQLQAERGQIVSVTGEAGLGKSRIVAEMRQQLDDEAVRWIEGRCLSYTESVSYYPFQQIIWQLLGVRPGDSDAEAWNKLRDALDVEFTRDMDAHTVVDDEGLEATLPYLATFLNLPLEASLYEKVRYLDAEALQRRTFVAINTLIRTYYRTQPGGAKPLVLVFEDIHWIDQASLDLLAYLMPLVNRMPLMILLLYRPERAKACWNMREKALREFPHCTTEIVLQPLTPEDSQRLLVNLIGEDDWSTEMYEAILTRTEGNPLYVEEIIRACIETGTLTQTLEGTWEPRKDVHTIKVPDTLQGVLMARLDRLEEPCRWTAQLASVVGRVFFFDVLAHIESGHVEQLNHCLARLQQQEIVRETQRAPELVYTFKHAMTQEVCYRTLLARTRRLYHRRIAEYLETERSVGRRDAEANVPLIAHHVFEGQDWERAMHYQLLAAQQAEKLFANHEAIDHLEKALQSATHVDEEQAMAQRQVIHVTLGQLLTTTGQYERALEHLDAARDLAIARDDSDAEAHASRWLARLYELRGEYAPALEWIQRGLDILNGRETAEVAELLLIAGLIHSRQGAYQEAQVQFRAALDIGQRLDEVAVLARAYNGLGVIALRHNSVKAIEYFQQAFALYARIGDIQGQATSHNLMANAYFNVGQWDQADHHYRRAREIFDQIGDVYNRIFVDNNLGGIALNQGRLDEALSFYQQSLQALKQIGGSPYVLGVLYMNMGATLIDCDELEEARESLRTSQDYYRQAKARDFLPELHRHFAEVALWDEDLAEAEVQVQKALDLARELTLRGEEGIALRVQGEIALLRGRLDEAAQYLSESLEILQEVADEYETARAQMVLVRVHEHRGDREQALIRLDQCTRVFRKLGARLDLEKVQVLREELASEKVS